MCASLLCILLAGRAFSLGRLLVSFAQGKQHIKHCTEGTEDGTLMLFQQTNAKSSHIGEIWEFTDHHELYYHVISVHTQN